MAKRSVRKQRRAAERAPRAGAPRAAAPAPAARPVWRSSAFWLGGVVVGLAVAAIAVAVVVLTGADDEQPAAAGAPAPAEEPIRSAEELEADFDARDREQIESLTADAEAVAERLAPVMQGLEDALPRSGKPAAQLPDGRTREWLDLARDAAAPYADSISGNTGHNVARNAIRAALDGLVNALETYRLAAAPGADVEALHAQAAAQRDNAIRTWSTAGVQIDAINIEAGLGHQHIAQLGGAEAGALPPDSLPEGTDAHVDE